jgi:predicted kinase
LNLKNPVALSPVKLVQTKKPFIRDNLPMERSGTGPRLIIVCGLPGSGKTTRAKTLESRLRGIRFSPDEWMDALSLDIYDEESRGKIESLQWKLAQQLLALGLIVIIEWGTWGRAERDTLRLGARALGAAVELHHLSAPADVLCERIQRRGLEKPPITRDALYQWFEMFQAPTPEEMALFDKPLAVDLAAG